MRPLSDVQFKATREVQIVDDPEIRNQEMSKTKRLVNVDKKRRK